MYRKLGMYLLAALLVLLPVSAAIGEKANAASSSRIAVIKQLSGDVQVQKAGGSKQFKAFAKLSLNQGDKLITGSKGSAVLQFANGTSEDDKFTVGENATLTFSKLSDKKGTVTKVSMLKGTAWVDVKSIKSKDDDFKLETPTAIMGVRGTAFFARVNPATGGTNTAVMSGVVRFTSENAEKTGSASGESTGGTGSSGARTIDLYPTQQIALEPTSGSDLGELTTLVDIEEIVKNASPEVIEAILRSKEKIDEENRQTVEKFKQTGVPAELQQGLDKFAQNIEELLGVIAKQAIEQKKIDQQQVKKIEEQEKTSFDLDKDRLSQLDEKEKAKQEKAKLLAEEAAKRKAAEEAAKLKELADKINAAALKAIEAAKQAQDEANRQAAEAAKRKAEAELLKKLNEQQKQQYQTDKTNNQGGTTVTPGTNTGNLSSNANLGSLSIDGATLSPSFNAAVADYRASVASDKTSIVVEASVQDSGASFTINGQAPSDGRRTVSLAYGDNEISVLVTAQNGATKTYKLTVTRQLLNNVSVVFPGQNGIDIDFNSTSAPAPLSIPSGSSNLTLVVPVTGPELDIAVNGQNVEPEPMFMAARTILPNQISWRYIIPLVQASNEIEIKATIDGVIKSYKLLANRSMSNETAVQSVAAVSADGTATYEVAASGTDAWMVKVPYDTASVKLKISTISGNAKVLLGTGEYASGAEIPYTIINLAVPFHVRAADGETLKAYTLTIQRLPSSNAMLSNLVLSEGTLTPTFASDKTSYTASVGHATGSITVTPTAAGSAASIKVNDTAVASGRPSGAITLADGSNQITIEVAAQDGTRQKYTVIVTRENAALAAPSFNPPSGAVAFGTALTISSEGAEHIYYTTDGSEPATSVTGVTKEYAAGNKPTIQAAGTFKAIATRAGYPNSPVASASYTQAASADLTDIALSGSVSGFSFASGTYEYENVIVSSDTSNITVKAQGIGSITINGEGVASGESSQAINLFVGEPRTITVVAAEVGKTPKTYVIVVTRAANANANLASLSISTGTLSPVFESGITEYTTSVPYTVSSIRVTPTVAVGTSAVEVNGLATVSGNESEDLPLNLGGNTVTVNVRSQSGFTRSYTINVTRQAASQDSTLSSLSIPDSALNPAFDPYTKDYKLSVPYATNGLFVYATASSPFATVTGAGPHALDVGENVIKVIVTAQDGATVSEYNITITRAQPPSSDTKLQSLSVSEGILEPEFNPSQHNYAVVVPHETDSIGITAVTNSSAASVEGDGQHALHVGSNDLPVTVTAEDGTTATYLIVVEREADTILSSIAGVTSWIDTRSDDQDVTWHVGRDYRYEDILYAEVPDATVAVSSSITFDENVTSASLRKQYSEELIGSYEASGSQTMDVDYGVLESGDNVFVLSIEEGEAESNDYVIDLKAGQSRQALSMISGRLEQGEGSLAVSHNDTYNFTLIMPSRNASFYLSLYPENVTGDLDIEHYGGVEGGSLFVGASSLDDGWNELKVQMKDIAGNAGLEDTVISVWRPSGEDESEPASLSLSLDAFAFENDGNTFYPENVGQFGFYSLTAQGTTADFSFFPSLTDSASLVESVYIVDNENTRTELSPDGEGKYSFGMNLGDNVEIAVRDSEGHRFMHRIHINHTLQEAGLPAGVLAWSVQGVEVNEGTYLNDDNYYYASLSETLSDPSMKLVLDPSVYAGAALYHGTGFMERSKDPVASWNESAESEQLVSGLRTGYNSYTLELYPASEEEETTIYTVTIENGPASIYGLSLWETFNGGDFTVDAGWTNTGTESSPVYQGYTYSNLRYLRFDMNFDENAVSDVSLEEIESASPVEFRKYKSGGYYSFDTYNVPDGLRHLKLTVTERGGAATHEYDLFVHFDPQDNGVARVTSDIQGMPVYWTWAEGVEEETNEGYVQRHYAIVAADKAGSVLDWSIALQSESLMELQYEIVEASIDGDSELVDVDEFGLQARGGLSLTHGYHDIRLKYKSFPPMSEEIAQYYIREWIVFVGDSSQMTNAPEAGLDGERVSLTKDEAHEYAPISMEWEGLNLTANVDNGTEGAILEAGGYSPYSRVEIEYLNERPYEITEGHYYLSNLNEGPNEVTIKVIDPTGTVEQSYTLVIYRAEKGGEVPPAPPARLSSLRIGSELVPIAEGQYAYTVYLPYGAPASMQVHAVALDQDRVELAVNDQPWAWDDDDEEHVLAPNEAGEYELEVSSADGSYATSVYHILVERLLTDDTRIDGDVPVSWSSGGQDTWISEALELEEGDWLSMNFDTPAGYHLYFKTDGTVFDPEPQHWYLDSGMNRLEVEVKRDSGNDLVATYEFYAYNWNTVLVTNKTDGTDPDRVQAIKWNGVYYAALPTYWFNNEASPSVGIKTLHGLDEMNTVGWNFKVSAYEGTLTHADPAGHSIVRKVSVFAPAHMPAFEAQFQGGSFGWYNESYPRFFYGNDERPGAYFWTNDNTMIPNGVNLRVSQSEGDIHIYAMDNDEQPFERSELDGKWNWSLPLSWLESDGDVRTYKVVVKNNGKTTVYLLSFGIGDSGTA